ncbi:glycosyltransferase family 2 protein [Xylocopilactobacillus apicola]|uniref:Glycosyl transferase family 2 n=1 Tax=Xylocopilactobacillus apicola TaxID=2932184 RepID=A0AAU9CXT4_9LACO|nr:glycosyltransferase family 2 protein [Xylocopilactobacillus apicola]BDR58822.1 glycosyl transferase family 2 [Xylocopilactobacillus apicola]
MIQFIYLFFISLFGFKNPKRDYEIQPDQARFLILIAAHNEEAVIGNTLMGLQNLEYDPKLYKIIVVNDNSTDRTGEICDELGIEHVDTIEGKFPREGVGKPGGIQYALRALGFEKLIKKYDLLFILDADNHVDNNILREINSQWLTHHKPESIQSYLGVKNWNSILAAGYAINYWTTNRFFQLAKYRLHLPASIGGTGFAVRIDWLIWNGGFKYKSLTEDLEMEIQIVEDRGRVLWNHFAKIYDEKPDRLKVAMVQRFRWAKGHWYVCLTNFYKLFLDFLKSGNFSNIDQIMYLFSMAQVVEYFAFIIALLYAALASVFGHFSQFLVIKDVVNLLIPSTGITIFFGVYQFIVLPFFATLRDAPEKKYFTFIFLGLPYYSWTYLIDQFWGLVNWRQQGKWVRTPHDKEIIIKKTKDHQQVIIQKSSLIESNNDST